MKKLLLLVSFLFVGITNYAQTNEYIEMARAILEKDTKEAIAEIVELDDSQKEEFWLLVNEYEDFSYFVKDKRIAIIKEYAENYENLTDEKADELINQAFDFKMEDLKLKKKYYKKMKKIIPATEAAKFIQAVNKIDDLVNAELATEIPLIE
ncbi:hypothetical protein [Algibacter mikhailovii]|uniref:Sensor of ECF-type sigma factor n=1 Tax=Algibacter mikhailovii TaxID=425498 RepID=A0A918R1M8_9FLAO|nr:hypothetical protein [Algibacter mikhailovii]GGZ80609.1 hypothetical protein GCM10007028_17450 [Algibacter mikhailovii]